MAYAKRLCSSSRSTKDGFKEICPSKGGPPSDYMHVTYDLKPGESIEGDVKLHNMFPTFLKDIKKYGVVIRWRCKAKHIDFTCKQGAGGEFVIPKGGLPGSSPSKKDK